MGAMLAWYQATRGTAWVWQAADTKLLAAPLGGEATGAKPTDRGKGGTIRYIWSTDGGSRWPSI